MKRRNEFDIYAVSEGIVFFVGEEVREDGYKSKYGIRVLVEHKDGTIGWYCHLKKTVLKKDDIVKAGSIIGRMGNTGMAEQTHIRKDTLQEIKKYDYDLYIWLLMFKKGDNLIALEDIKVNLKYSKRLYRYLDKHLHLMLTPDRTKLHGKYAINPLPWLLDGIPPSNTSQSIDGGYRAIYKDSEGKEYQHEGIDMSGRVVNLIEGWRFLNKTYINNFRSSIDEVA